MRAAALLLSLAVGSVLGLLGGLAGCSAPPGTSLLHVSFDATRELYDDVNAAFEQRWLAEHGTPVTIRQSHGGSGKQARAVLDGLPADVVTLALPHDIDMLARGGLLPADWAQRLPNDSAPWSSTIVFVVRAGNPKHIVDWPDLTRPDVDVTAPNPKTSGGARLITLAAWDSARRSGANDADADAFVGRLYQNVGVLDTGARGSATTFSERGLGDVLLAWESDARLLVSRTRDGPAHERLQLVVPSSSVRADLAVAVVDDNVDRHGTRALAEAYAAFLYSPQAQAIAARHHHRPGDPQAAASDAFPHLPLRTVNEIAGGWPQAQARFFDDGALFDRLFEEVSRQP